MNSLRRILFYLKPYWKQILFSILFLFLVTSVDLLIPRQIQRIIDQGIVPGNMALVGNVMLIMIALVLTSMLFSIGNIVLAVRVSESFAADIRDAAYRQTQRFSFGNLDRLQTGELLVRLTSDVGKIKLVTMMTLVMAFRAPLMIVGALAMMLTTSPRLAVLLIALLPLITLLLWGFTVKSRPLYNAVQQRLDRLNTILQENLAGVHVVKAFVRADYENQRFDQANTALTDTAIQVNQLAALLMPTMIAIINAGMIAVVWFGGSLAIKGLLTEGEIVAFINYLLMAMMPIFMMGMILPMLAAAEVSARRIFEIIDAKTEVQNRPNAKTLNPAEVRGRITFENVSFAYDCEDCELDALQNISFSAEPGETIAILGATGSGKTSLVNLIPRFYDVTAGRVTIDGVDVRDVTKESLRALIGVCLQEAALFSGSLYDNIAYGSPHAAESDIIAAAEIAAAREFIMKKPKGFQATVGQRGAGLSGGQKQRIAIARALARNPKILILDDSASAVDVATEAKIQDALEDAYRHTTRFIVAQRISSVLTADKIIVLSRGRIAAMGTHRELLADSSIYREIYESQLGKAVNNEQ